MDLDSSVARKHNLLSELTLLPNILTMMRIALIPLILYFIDNESLSRSFIAAGLYSISALTDFVDGYLARKYNQTSLLGKFLDPLADKILVMATLVWMVPMGRIDAWLVVLLLAREFSITGLRSVASSEGLVISARQKGKHKTALQMIGILCLVLHFRYPVILTNAYVDTHLVGTYIIYISLVFSIFSAVEYLVLFARAVKGRADSPDDDAPARATRDLGTEE
jgi:CDP-diacylglycerol--glycerol-3-phosphate 3-phosphatidyltransferase